MKLVDVQNAVFAPSRLPSWSTTLVFDHDVKER